MSRGSRANANNHSNQMNPNNRAYWSSRGGAPPAGTGTKPTVTSEKKSSASDVGSANPDVPPAKAGA